MEEKLEEIINQMSLMNDNLSEIFEALERIADSLEARE